MQNIHVTDRMNQRQALDKLGQIIDKAVKREPLTDDELQALRAAADHAGREAAFALRQEWDGSDMVNGHDALDWCEMLTYVADPF